MNPQMPETTGLDGDQRDGCLQEMLRFVPWIQETYAPQTKRVRAVRWVPRYQHLSYPLAFLFKNRIPGNPHAGERRLLEMAVGLGDGLLTQLTPEGLLDDGDDKPNGTPSTEEWPLYYLARTAEVLGEDLNEQSRAKWARFAADYAAFMLPRPFFFTSPNHEAWRCAALVHAAEAFGRREWIEPALFLVRALADYQTPEGFWEEGRHHSTSTTYNYVMLDPLYLLAQQTGDPAVKEMARKLADFMTSWTLPDGGTCGCLDGRQAFSPAYQGVGLSLTARGRRLNRRSFETAARLETADPLGRFYAMSNGNAHIQVAMACDRFRFAMRGPEDALPVEAGGFRAESHSGTFDAAQHRRGPWCAVVSGIVSDISVGAASPFRLSRESRLDLWHERAGLLIGGGNSPAGAALPQALVHVVTGHQADCDFGLVRGGAEIKARQALYYPRAARARVEPDGVAVRLTYAHARVDVAARVRDDAHAEVRFRVEALGARKLYLQIPFVACHDAEVRADGKILPHPPAATPPPVVLESQIEIRERVYAAKKIVQVPKGLKACVHFPIQPLRSYGTLDSDERYASVFEVGLISVEIPTPPPSGEWVFPVEVQAG